MEGGGGKAKPSTLQDIFRDFRGRRAGLIKALTTDADELYSLCDPEGENLYLYGLPDGTWKLSPPEVEVPSLIPEPVLGINFARDGMDRKEWLSLIASHSDAWSVAVAFYFGGLAPFGKADRNRLFQKMSRLPTILEVMNKAGRKRKKDKAPKRSAMSDKSSSMTKINCFHGPSLHPVRTVRLQRISSRPAPPEEDGDKQGEGSVVASCGLCGLRLGIRCDVCGARYHAECVKITLKNAERIKKFECTFCAGNMRVRF